MYLVLNVWYEIILYKIWKVCAVQSMWVIIHVSKEWLFSQRLFVPTSSGVDVMRRVVFLYVYAYIYL